MNTRFSCGCRNIQTKKGTQTYVCDEVKDEDMKPGDKRLSELEKEKRT